MSTKKRLLTIEEQLKRCGIQISQLSNGMFKVQDGIPYHDYTQVLQNLDHMQATSRYMWKNLPNNLTSYQLESLLYMSKGLCVFYSNNTLYALPYTFSGTLNYYSYPTRVSPITLNGERITDKELVVAQNGNINKNANCVLLFDRPPIYANNYIPQRVLSQELIETENEIIKRAQINLYNSTKKLMYGVDNEAQSKQAKLDVESSLSSDSPVTIYVKGDTYDGEMINTSIPNETNTIMLYFQNINNLRVASLGLTGGMVMEKKERMTNSEVDSNALQSYLVLWQGLETRKQALKLLKELYPNVSEIQAIEVSLNPIIEATVNNFMLGDGDQNKTLDGQTESKESDGDK